MAKLPRFAQHFFYMKKQEEYIDCSDNYQFSKRDTPFHVVYYSLNYQSDVNDRLIIDRFIVEAKRLADKVNKGRANDSYHSRSNQTILANCTAGVVSEFFWKKYINEDGEYVQSTPFDDPTAQIDLELIQDKRKIEVRSSFPRKGVDFAICHPVYQFDILGPYSNNYKPGEVEKDFYVRTLFHLEQPTQIIDRIKKDHFVLCLTGGATWDMMWNSETSLEKDLIPEDQIGVLIKTSYRVVPFSSTLGTREMKSLIIGEKSKHKENNRTINGQGHCIRCGGSIDFCYGLDKPRYYCKDCWREWYRAGHDTSAREKFCHRCGKQTNRLSFDRPLCYDCWKLK